MKFTNKGVKIGNTYHTTKEAAEIFAETQSIYNQIK